MSRLHFLAIWLVACSTPSAWAQTGVPRQGIVLEVDRPVLDALEEPFELEMLDSPLRNLPLVLAEYGVSTMIDLKALDDVGYTGWAISEQPGQAKNVDEARDLARRMGRIIAL